MSSVTVFVGMDYHQSFIQVCVMNETGEVVKNRRCANDVQAVITCVGQPGHRVVAALEACCGAADLADELVAAGWQVSLAHAGYVNKMKQSVDKTDGGDARVLADLQRVGYLPKVWLPPVWLRQLRDLVRYRQQLANARRTAKLRITALLRSHRVELSVPRWTKAWIAGVRDCTSLGPQGQWIGRQLLDEIEHLQQRLDAVEARLAEVTAQDALTQKLLSYQGIGLVTAVTLRAEWGDVGRFHSGKQLSRFSGLSPRNASSGLKQADAGLIRAGNPQLRAILIEAAHRLQRCDRRWLEFGLEMRRRGKPGSVIAAAVANRWVRALYHDLKEIQAA